MEEREKYNTFYEEKITFMEVYIYEKFIIEDPEILLHARYVVL